MAARPVTHDAIPDALALLAANYERIDSPIQAVHCLQALVNRQLPPDFEAKARLHLGRLLVEHTYNYKEASSQLLRAQMLARSLIGNYGLKCEIQDYLATCFQYLGEDAMELQACTAASELSKPARGSSEWPVVCGWMCRLAQRAAALHARCGRPDEAMTAAREGLAFADANGMQQHRLVFLLLVLQLSLGRWDHATADSALLALREGIQQAAGVGEGGGGGAVLDAYSYPYVLLHLNLLQALYLLRVGKVADVVKPERPLPQAEGAPAADPDGPDVPPPPVLATLEAFLAQFRQAEQQMAEGAKLLYTLPGLPSLEPMVCLLGATALRGNNSRPRLVDRYMQRGLDSLAPLLAAAGIDGAVEEAGIPRQCVAGARAALSLQLLLLQCRAQVALSKAKLCSAREDVLSCQQLQERFPALLRELLPGVHLLTGQYCVAMGEMAAAAAHFQVARLNAPSRSAAALAAVLEAEVHLTPPPQQQQQQQPGQGQGQGQAGQQQPVAEAPRAVGDVARALAALGPFYAMQDGLGAAPGGAGTAAAGAGAAASGGVGGGESRLLGAVGRLEDAACMVASAACLVQQGQLAEANSLLSRALKLAFKRLGHTQLTCAILNHLAPIFLAQNPPDIHSATEAASSACTLSATAGDLWAEAQAKRLMSEITRRSGDTKRQLAEAASAERRRQRIGAAKAEVRGDTGRHGYAVGWGLASV